MDYIPGSHGYMPSVMLSSFSPESQGRHVVVNTVPASATGTSNRMIYVAFSLNRAAMVYKLWWLNGATVGTDNLRVAVYNGAFSRLILGTSTLSAGANICQYDNITDTVLPAGRYYMVLWCSGSTATVFRSSSNSNVGGIYYETNASGPQATGTPVAPASVSPQIPMFGLQLRSSP